jgi:hypothetical protein
MSAGQGREIDPEVIRAGGPEFAKRLAQFKSAKDAAETAFANLKLGQDAAIAYDNAQRDLGEATATAQAMIAEAEAKAEAMIKAAEAAVATKRAERDAIMAELRQLLAEMQRIRQGWD